LYLAQTGPHEDADSCASELLGGGGLSAEQPPGTPSAPDRSSWRRADWPAAERDAAIALRENRMDYRFAWVLTRTQLLRDRADAAWRTYTQVNQPLVSRQDMPVWLDLQRLADHEDLLIADAHRQLALVDADVQAAIREAVDLTGTPNNRHPSGPRSLEPRKRRRALRRTSDGEFEDAYGPVLNNGQLNGFGGSGAFKGQPRGPAATSGVRNG